MSAPTARRLAAAALTAMVSATCWWGATPATAAPAGAKIGRAVAPSATSASSANGSVARQDASSTEALTRLNALRKQFGVNGVGESATWSAAARAHSTYMATNGVLSNAEDPAQRGYTPEGNTSALNSHVAMGWSTPTQFIDAWAASPFHLITMLSPRLATSGYGQASVDGRTAATLNVLQGRTAAEPTTGWPRTWPRGTTSILELSDGASPDPAAGCGAPSGSWFGTASLVDFGPGATVSSASATLLEDGVPVPVCVRTAAQYSDATARSLMAGKVLVIPLRPLVKNKGYSGTVTTSAGAATLRFDTGNPASGVFGDHNGDGRADILAVRRDTEELAFYQTRPGPSVAPGVIVGRGWNGWDWMAGVPDLNGDGRTELIGRDAASGKLYLFRGLGRGLWSSKIEIGRGFGGLSLLTVVDDITGDKRPELLGRTADGSLMRFSFGVDGAYLTNTTKIGRGWGVITQMFSPGDFSGDGTPDLVAVRFDGQLVRYGFGNGAFTSMTVVGRGWNPADKLWSPGDLDGNGTKDLLAIRNGHELYFYANRVGTWSVAAKVGSGWSVMRMLA